MALLTMSVARATAPHLPALATTLAPLLALANAGGFHLQYAAGAVAIQQGSFAGVSVANVNAAVAAAPVATPQLDAQSRIDVLPILDRAIVLALIDQLNVIRAALPAPLAAITPAQAIAAVRAKAGTL